MLMESWVKFRSPQNISGASQQQGLDLKPNKTIEINIKWLHTAHWVSLRP